MPSQGAFPSPARLLAHSSSCIFRQCCHRVVREHPDVGRAGPPDRPGPLCGHPGSPWLLEKQRPCLKYISSFTHPSRKKLSLTVTTDLVLGMKDFQSLGLP